MSRRKGIQTKTLEKVKDPSCVPPRYFPMFQVSAGESRYSIEITYTHAQKNIEQERAAPSALCVDKSFGPSVRTLWTPFI